MSISDKELHGLTESQRMAEEGANAAAMYRLNRKDGPTPYYLNCPIDAVEDVARNLRSEPVILFQWAYHVIKVGDDEWRLDNDLHIWRKARACAMRLVKEGLLVDQSFQSGFAFGRPESVIVPDSQLSCLEWQDRHGVPCGGYKVGCDYCPSAEY